LADLQLRQEGFPIVAPGFEQRSVVVPQLLALGAARVRRESLAQRNRVPLDELLALHHRQAVAQLLRLWRRGEYPRLFYGLEALKGHRFFQGFEPRAERCQGFVSLLQEFHPVAEGARPALERGDPPNR
jgi:hypothetical protein